MEKEIIEWILTAIPNEYLIRFANELGIKMPGFRAINVKTINNIPKRLLVQKMVAGKLLIKAKKALGDWASSAIEVNGLRTETLNDLYLQYENEIYLPLSALITSENSEDTRRAVDLYHLLKEDQTNNLKNETHRSDVNPPEDTVAELQKMIREHENIIKKSTQEINELKKTNKRLKEQLEKQTMKNKNEKYSLSNELLHLKDEHRSASKRWFEEKGHLLLQIQSLEDELQKKQDEITKLNAHINNFGNQAEVAVSNQAEEYVVEEKKRVIIIGRVPSTHKFDKALSWIIQTSDDNDIKTTLENINLDNYQEIWVLTYGVPLSLQMKMRRTIDSGKLKEFSSFDELKNYIAREDEKYDIQKMGY